MSTEARSPLERSEIPGPRSRELGERLAAVESRNVTALEPEVPIFWERAEGASVWDVDGNHFVDLSAAFGVASVGHSHPEVAEAVARQASTLLHGMGDVYPPRVKVELLEALCAHFPGGDGARAVLGSSGSDAVETAIKTAMLATGRSAIVAFEGGYHGLSLGALATTERATFREPFASRLAGPTHFAPYGETEPLRALAEAEVAAVIVEPLQGRGGERIPPEGFLRELRTLCDERGWLLIADEIYTGCGRTGRFFACEHEGVVPDLLCVGKGLAAGMPLSACLGRPEVMEAWPASKGEALHTQTFLGHPAACAAGLASLGILERENLVRRSAQLGAEALDHLDSALSRNPRAARAIREVRGRGLMIGVEGHGDTTLRACRRALLDGVIALPSGSRSEVLGITPPLSIERDLLFDALDRIVLAFAA